MFFNRVAIGFQIVKESFIVLWQHKILAAYMTAATFLFASIQYLLSYNFTYTIKESDKITEFISQGGVWSNTVSKNFIYKLLNHGPAHRHFTFLFLVALFSFIMTFFTICLIRHVLRILEHKKFDFSFIYEKLSAITAWTLFITVLHALKILAELDYWSPLYTAIIIWSIAIFIVVFVVFVLPIIADTSLNIFKAMVLSLRIIANCWIELFTTLIILALYWLIWIYPVMRLLVSSEPSNFLLITLVWIPIIIGLTITDIVRTLLYSKVYKKV